jgi:hypothetical protein
MADDDTIGDEIGGGDAPRVDQPVLAVRYVWTVHITLANEVRPTEAVFRRENSACARAREMSKDTEVLAASVVRFTVDELGTRTGVAMFVNGQRQMVPYVSDCRGIYANGRKQ